MKDLILLALIGVLAAALLAYQNMLNQALRKIRELRRELDGRG